ncbi:cytochrome P450 [Schizophyllum commune]
MLLTIAQDALVCALIYSVYRYLTRQHIKRLPLPPGPPAELLLGHLRIAPQQDAERTYFRWSKEYKSSLIHIKVLGQHIIVIHDLPTAIELLEKRGSIYSDRPLFAYFDMFGWYENLTTMGYSHPSFSLLRREYQNHFAKGAERRMYDLQTNEAHKLVKRIIESPEKWRSLLELFTTSIIIRIVTGHEIKDVDDEYVSIASDVSHTLKAGGPPGATGVDICPLLRYLPSCFDPTGTTAYIRKMRYAIKNLYNVPYNHVQSELAAGTAPPSFLRSLIEDQQAEGNSGTGSGLTKEQITGLGGTAFAAGADTSEALDTLTTFIFAIVNHLDVQEKAHAELDAVVGPNRLPEMEDRKNLPYVERIVQETFRFWPAVPLGVPHKSMEDDVYDDMFIPKGSLLLFNAFAMGHEETIYSDPWKFNPDRYMPHEEGGRGEPLPVGHFGFGRRIYPGLLVGEATVFIAIATMLHVLVLKRTRNEKGEEIIVDPETAKYTTGLTSHPETVLCDIEPASERAKQLATEAYTD